MNVPVPSSQPGLEMTLYLLFKFVTLVYPGNGWPKGNKLPVHEVIDAARVT
jgi:hypothetical protein